MIFNTKNKLLLLGFLLALYISYALAISKTLYYFNDYQSKKELISLDVSSPDITLELLQKEKQLDQLLKEYKISGTFQNNLLKQIDTYSEHYHLKIVDFQEPHRILYNGMPSDAYIFSLQGTFNSCLALINKIEGNAAFGSVQHINFIKKKDYKTNADYLVVEVVLIRNQDD